MAKKKSKNKSLLAVYNLKQAEQVNGSFVKKEARIVRSGVKVFRTYADNYNKNFNTSGSFYELDEKATNKLG